MIGTISKPSCAFVRQSSFAGSQGARSFLDGYQEAIGLVGVGLHIVPIVVLGVWPFPGTSRGGLERRCLITRDDGSDNDAIYNSILKYHPSLARLGDDVIMAFIPEKTIKRAPRKKMVRIGYLSACFDIASWFVDTLPFMRSRGLYELTRRDVKALALGIFTNILITRLCFMGIVTAKQLMQMRMSICDSVMDKMAHYWAPPHPAASQGGEGMMTRLWQILAGVSDMDFMQDMRDPDFVFQKILVQSLRYFQQS